jgi:hypothetical protein
MEIIAEAVPKNVSFGTGSAEKPVVRRTPPPSDLTG